MSRRYGVQDNVVGEVCVGAVGTAPVSGIGKECVSCMKRMELSVRGYGSCR